MNTTALTRADHKLDLGLAVLRIVVGIVFAAHGAQKFFMYGLEGVTAGFQGMGVPMPSITAPMVATVELLGGIALIIGLLTRLASVGLAITMLGALLMVHLAAGFFLPNGYEFVLTLCAAAVALALTGPGAYSVDAAIRGRRAGR